MTREMKRLDIEDFSDIKIPSFESIELTLKQQSDDDYPIPLWRKILIRIGSGYYYFVAEAWFPGCLEDREGNWGKTNPSNIARVFKQIMEKEAGFDSKRSGYVKSSPAGEYGVTWIASANKASSVKPPSAKKSSTKEKTSK